MRQRYDGLRAGHGQPEFADGMAAGDFVHSDVLREPGMSYPNCLVCDSRVIGDTLSFDIGGWLFLGGRILGCGLNSKVGSH